MLFVAFAFFVALLLAWLLAPNGSPAAARPTAGALQPAGASPDAGDLSPA
jgi:hypothetical protein